MKNLFNFSLMASIILLLLSSCSKKCEAFSEDRIDFFPIALENKSFSYISGEKQIKMQGLPLVKSEEYTKSNNNKTRQYCHSSAKMLVKGMDSSVNIQMSYESIYVDCADCSFGPQGTSVCIYNTDKNDFPDLFLMPGASLKKESVTLNNKTYTDVYSIKSSIHTTAEILFVKNYGIIQFTLDGTEVWQLKVD